MVNDSASPAPVSVMNGPEDGLKCCVFSDKQAAPSDNNELSSVVLKKTKPHFVQSKQPSESKTENGEENGIHNVSEVNGNGSTEAHAAVGGGDIAASKQHPAPPPVNLLQQQLPTKSPIGPSPLSLHSVSSGDFASATVATPPTPPTPIDVKLRPKAKPKPKPPAIVVSQHCSHGEKAMEIKEVEEEVPETETVPSPDREPSSGGGACRQTNGLENGVGALNGEVEKEEAQNGLGSHAVPRVNGVDETAAALLHRTMESLYQANPDLNDNTEEIRRLDSQLDNLNKYMDRVEQRLQEHNDKLMATLRQQREEREKRRRSFHERMEANQKEDNDFQRQLTQILSRVDISRNRNSYIEETTTESGEDPTGEEGENVAEDKGVGGKQVS